MSENNLNQTHLPDPDEIFATASEDFEIAVEPYGVLTTAEEVRAVFGLSAAELSDEMLSQRVYTREIASALASLDSTLADTYYTKVAQKSSLRSLVENFALYCMANKLCDVLPLITARTLSDSKASFQRFDTDLQKVAQSIKQRYALARDGLSKALADLAGETQSKQMRTPVMFGRGVPTVDRVSNEGNG